MNYKPEVLLKQLKLWLKELERKESYNGSIGISKGYKFDIGHCQRMIKRLQALDKSLSSIDQVKPESAQPFNIQEIDAVVRVLLPARAV